MTRPPKVISNYPLELPLAIVFSLRAFFALLYGPNSPAFPGTLEATWPFLLASVWHGSLLGSAALLFVGIFGSRRRAIVAGDGITGILLFTYGVVLFIQEIHTDKPIVTGATYLTVAVICLLRAWSETETIRLLREIIRGRNGTQ